jgi:hypothetical protein
MTTSCLKPVAQTSQRIDRSAPLALRVSDRQPKRAVARSFLKVLLRSLSAWAV